MRLRVWTATRPSRRTQAVAGLGGVLILGTVAVVAIGGSGTGGAPAAYATVAEGDVSATAGAAGNVQSADSRDLAFGTSGTVSRVYAKVGEKVKENTRLAVVDQTEAEENLQSAKAALTAAEAVLDGTDTGGTSAASAAGGTGTTTTANAVNSANAVSTAIVGYASPTPTPSPSATSTTSDRPSAPASAPASRAPAPAPSSSKSSGSSGGAPSAEELQAKVTQAKNTVDQAQRALDGTVIKAPISGTVLAVDGQAGDVASASTTFITIGDLDEVQVDATFSQNDVARVRVGQEAKITLTADTATTYDGTVARIDSDATTSDTNNDTLVKYGVMIAFDDLPSRLLIGQSATVAVTTASTTNTLYVPSSAVRSGANGTYTVQVRNGNRTVIRTVEIGVRGDAYIEIKSGLSTGDRVLTSR